jgi:uncharacterized damage-inducible protein DinB
MSSMDSDRFKAEFIEYAIAKLRENCTKIRDCVGRLSEEQVWERASWDENAAGNLLLHLQGNVRQWIGSGVAGLLDVRDRPAEFSADRSKPKGELVTFLESTVEEMCGQLATVDQDLLMQSIEVQNRTLSRLRAIFHVVEHFSYHTGQIVYITKNLVARHQAPGAPINFDRQSFKADFA